MQFKLTFPHLTTIMSEVIRRCRVLEQSLQLLSVVDTCASAHMQYIPFDWYNLTQKDRYTDM